MKINTCFQPGTSKRPSCLLFLITLVVLCSSALTDAGTLRDKNGEIMRGTRMVLGKPYRPDSDMPTVSNTLDLQEWLYLKELGFNAIRIVWIDPFVKDQPSWNYPGSWWEVDEVIPYLDKAIENATQSGMNVIINYHNVGEYVGQPGHMDELSDFGEMAEFWEKVAPRYANNDLVYYELNNEQTWNSADYYKPEFIATMRSVYEQVRTDAPKRTIIMFSFNNIAQPMKDIADTYTFIDWDYTAVGYHMYGWVTNTESSEIASLEKLLASDYPTICTEWGYDYEEDYYKPYLGYKINAQALEHYAQSWFDWRNWKETSLSQITEVLIPDAKANGYYWISSVAASSTSSAVSSTASSSSLTSSPQTSTSEAYSSSSSTHSAASNPTSSTSVSSNRSSSVSSTSSAQVLCTTGCNWYGKLYPLCVHEQTGWHWINNRSCIGHETCESQWGDGGLDAICYPASQQSSSSTIAQILTCTQSGMNQWEGGFTSEFILSIHNSSTDSWRLELEFSQQVDVTNTWSTYIEQVNHTDTGTALILKNTAWNGALNASDRLTFGIQGTTDSKIEQVKCTVYKS